jgi:putative ABC transport system ATP-binding protein
MSSFIIRLSDVNFRWRGQDHLTLDIPRFEVAPKERVFIHGPSGSGKTTLLNLLAGVSVPESGIVDVLDQNIAALSNAGRDGFRSDHIGLIFQMFNLVPYLSLIENVLLPCRFSHRRRERALAGDGDLESAAARLLSEMGLGDHRLQQRTVANLSVGQQQRVAVARALIGEPELITADEPTSSLDADAQRSFLQLLFDEVNKAGSTLLFVSHDRHMEDQFDRTIALSEINRVANSDPGGQTEGQTA